MACFGMRSGLDFHQLRCEMEIMDTNDDHFDLSTRQNELLKAPARKRKPETERHARRVVRMTWDVDQDNTSALLDDMGVSLMDEKSPENQKHGTLSPTRQAPTPYAPTQPEIVPPGAPKILHIPSEQPVFSTSFTFPSASNPYAYIEPQGTTDGLFFLSRRLPRQKTQITGINLFDRLSDEMILGIFRWLSKPVLVKCARVCKRWNRLTLDETLWRRLDVSNSIMKKGVLGRVLQRGVAMLRLAKADIRAPLFTDTCGIFNKQKFSKVQYLDLSMATISTESLEHLMSTCHLLRKLSLENCHLNDNICRYIGTNINLEVLNLSMCQGITENGLVPICNNLKRLDALNIAWTSMSRGAVLYLVICLPKSVTKLNLSGCRETLHDDDMHQLCNSCPGIKELDVSDSTLLTSLSVQYIATMLRGLEYIALSRCYHIMPSSLPLLGSIHTLLALDVFGMLRDSALIHLKGALSNIEINKFPFSSIARPTTGIRRTSIWGLRVRDTVV